MQGVCIYVLVYICVCVCVCQGTKSVIFKEKINDFLSSYYFETGVSVNFVSIQF